MPEAKRITGPTTYASSNDFCRIFHEETDSLYRLSFLLTADCEKAERCFVSGLEDSLNGTRVFKEWARSWARRAIIQNAVRVVNPRPMEQNAPASFNTSFNRSGRTLLEEQEEIAILDLAPFERFVYVMSVLEGYSDQDCSVLLGYSRRDVIAARTRALQQVGSAVGSAVELHVKQRTDVVSGKRGLHNNCRSVHELQLALRLATSA
jgi:DNA-directed RNA polymerase specialized sigma24 family protein